MKNFLLFLCFSLVALRAAEPPRFEVTSANATNLSQQYELLTTRLIKEFLETGKLSPESIQAYQLMVGIAKRNGVNLEKRTLRADDERNLGAALVIARLETIQMGYDRIYKLGLQNR